MARDNFRSVFSTYDPKYCPPELVALSFTTPCGWRDHDGLYTIAAEHSFNSCWAEFGAGGGKTARKLTRKLPADGSLFLFDAWEGLPHPWAMGTGFEHPAGSYCFPQLRTSEKRWKIISGWFSETLPYDFPEPLGLVNIDCDVYQSTRDVLNGITDWVVPGTVLIFDELHGYEYYARHEYRALNEWRQRTGRSVRWLGKDQFGAVGVVE